MVWICTFIRICLLSLLQVRKPSILLDFSLFSLQWSVGPASFTLGRPFGSFPLLFGLFLSLLLQSQLKIWGTFAYILKGAVPLIAVWAPHLPFAFSQRWPIVYPSFVCLVPYIWQGPSLIPSFACRPGSCRKPFLLSLPFGHFSSARWLFSLNTLRDCVAIDDSANSEVARLCDSSYSLLDK